MIMNCPCKQIERTGELIFMLNKMKKLNIIKYSVILLIIVVATAAFLLADRYLIEHVQFANLFKELGCTEAYNLDGGGSSTMYFMGRVVNNPLGRQDEWSVSDILYIKD